MSSNIIASRLTRRGCLQLATSTFALRALRNTTSFAAETGKPERFDLLVRSEDPFNAEPKLPQLADSYLTPVSQFFVRNHGNQPKIDVENYRISIEGAIERPLTLTLAELTERFPRVAVSATVTCAGNRRVEFAAEKPVPGVPWDAGAIGTAEWSGVALSSVLQHCGIKPDAKHVWFDGQDQITAMGEVRNFGGSVPLETVLAKEAGTRVLLADRMNDKTLTAEHGFPLRSIVAGYIGARSVKWLTKITVSDRPSSNFYLAKTYKIVSENTPENVAAAAPIYEFQTNSAICEAKLNPQTGTIAVRGYALSAGRRGNRIAEVSLTVDGGKSWQSAKITTPTRDFNWVLWSAELKLSKDSQKIQVKATDSEGTSQPARTSWNAQGYLYNGWHEAAIPKSA